MTYQVVLPEFEGPLDLLLHFITIHELDIYDIPIAFITGQYMEYLRRAEEIDLNLSGDFIVEAGTLLELKAKMLLPQREQEGTDGEAAPDPRTELVERLIAYKLHKDSAQELKRLETSLTRIYYRQVDEKQLLSMIPQPNPIGNLQPVDLQGAFQEILRLMSARRQVITIQKENTSIHDKMRDLLHILTRQPGELRFAVLWEECADIADAITVFLALLELMSKGLVYARQTEMFGDIYVGVY